MYLDSKRWYLGEAEPAARKNKNYIGMPLLFCVFRSPLIVIISFHNKIPVVFQGKISRFVTEEVRIAFLVDILMCHVFKLKSLFCQFRF